MLATEELDSVAAPAFPKHGSPESPPLPSRQTPRRPGDLLLDESCEPLLNTSGSEKSSSCSISPSNDREMAVSPLTLDDEEGFAPPSDQVPSEDVDPPGCSRVGDEAPQPSTSTGFRGVGFIAPHSLRSQQSSSLESLCEKSVPSPDTTSSNQCTVPSWPAHVQDTPPMNPDFFSNPRQGPGAALSADLGARARTPVASESSLASISPATDDDFLHCQRATPKEQGGSQKSVTTSTPSENLLAFDVRSSSYRDEVPAEVTITSSAIVLAPVNAAAKHIPNTGASKAEGIPPIQCSSVSSDKGTAYLGQDSAEEAPPVVLGSASPAAAVLKTASAAEEELSEAVSSPCMKESNERAAREAEALAELKFNASIERSQMISSWEAKTNARKEKNLVSEREMAAAGERPVAKGEEWVRVVEMCDLRPTAPHHKKDVSRFRAVLRSLAASNPPHVPRKPESATQSRSSQVTVDEAAITSAPSAPLGPPAVS
ncbi:hypothetical protein V5799_033955 [Amblyomma americanum]|uniref:Clathrin light chain n=1 Tax=Amblyomma americanum TaxID=6943 RepID=A0AAQ4DLU9_AMBAM